MRYKRTLQMIFMLALTACATRAFDHPKVSEQQAAKDFKNKEVDFVLFEFRPLEEVLEFKILDAKYYGDRAIIVADVKAARRGRSAIFAGKVRLYYEWIPGEWLLRSAEGLTYKRVPSDANPIPAPKNVIVVPGVPGGVPPPAGPVQGGIIGGATSSQSATQVSKRQPNLDLYCKDRNYGGATNVDKTGYGWKCVSKVDKSRMFGISVEDACKEQFGKDFSAKLTTPPPGGMNDWICVK